MDPRQQAQDYPNSNTQQGRPPYNFNGIQNDPFNAFVNTDNDSAFEPSWTNPALPAQQQHINGFDQGHHAWQQNPYQSANFLGTTNYGQSRDYEQSYSRSPSSYNYPGFDTGHNQPFAPNSYETPANPYEDPLYESLSNNAPYEYSESPGIQQHHETISPQALQTYPNAFNLSGADDSQHSQQGHFGTGLSVGRASTAGLALHNGPDWASLASATSDSISARGLHIKPTGPLSNATKSSRIDGFVFVGNGKQISAPIKVKVARNDRKRSLKTIRRIFETEKGSEALSQERGHLMKKLKLTESKLGARPVKSAAPSRTGSSVESESPSESSDSESDDDSAYYTESDVEMQPEEPSPIPASRPADPNKAVEYDVIKAVWAKRSVGLSSTVIRTALGDSWNIFKGIRDKWKLKATNLQQAIEKKDQANTKAYERRVVEQRRLLESCVGLTLKHGHPDIIEKLGENPAFLIIFYQFLADRVKDTEYASGLITVLLELMARCVTIDLEMLEKTKLDKVLPRISKRGDDQGKAFVNRILDNAANTSKQKGAGSKIGQRFQANGETQNSSSDIKAIKRESTEDSKRAPTLNSKTSVGTKTAKSSNGPEARQSPVKVEAKPGAKIASGDASSTTKIKTNHIPVKPTGFFAGLKSASKKPGTSAKAEEGKSNINVEPKVEHAPAPKSGFSFAATMAALETQKEAPPVKVQETRKPETPEEKKKRVRKEERRRLRVSFKADDDLVQIREFVHDPEEELGHEDSQVRDVKDTRGEGQMLKMHKDLDLEDDEDYEPPDEIVLPEWATPQLIDFSVIDEQELGRNYTSRGGRVEIKSEERVVQEQRELSTLMVVYTNHSDIPPSPREPNEMYIGDVSEESFGEPTPETKSREAAANAQRNPASAISPPMPDINNLLRIMQSQNLNQPQPPPQQPPQPAPPPTALEAIFAQFGNSNAQQAPMMQQPAQQPASGFNLQAALSGMTPTQQQSGFGAPPQPQVNIQAILAQMGSQPGPQAAQMQGYGYGTQPENDRKRQFGDDDGDFGRKRMRGGPGSDKLPYKTKVCKYWKEGKCRWGDGCSYLHE